MNFILFFFWFLTLAPAVAYISSCRYDSEVQLGMLRVAVPAVKPSHVHTGVDLLGADQ